MFVAGVDEVGRGAWAGPLVVGAVVLAGSEIPGLTDSKLLSKKARVRLDEIIRSEAAGVGLGWVSADELDSIGLPAALTVATKRALKELTCPFHQIIIDGNVNFLLKTPLAPYTSTIKKADLLVPSVSAASIVAKVARDNHMIELSHEYPGFGFEKNVGYGTALHRRALAEFGPTPIHRRSFAPVAEVVSGKPLSSGAIAEARAAEYLVSHGHEIIERNWRTKLCEIDIISQSRGTLYFVEVKYRRTDMAGDGLAAITKSKLQQMRFAAEMYLSARPSARESRLAAISLSGMDYAVEDFIVL